MRRAAALGGLDVLVGEWQMRAWLDRVQVGRGRTTFTWLEGGQFLRQRAEGEPTEAASAEWVAGSPFPVTGVIGLDDGTGRFSMLYADARGVSRVYEMSLEDGTWRLWREAPGFFQRFTGSLDTEAANATIGGRWETSPDGGRWEVDFELIYVKEGSAWIGSAGPS